MYVEDSPENTPIEANVSAEDAAPEEDASSTEVTTSVEGAANNLDETVIADSTADDATAAETSLLEVQDDDTYIAADEAPTTIAGADPTVAVEEEPTTFINDPDRIDVFTSDDVDSTAISHFDPSQFTVVSSGPSSVERKQSKDGSDSLRKVAFGLLAAVVVVGVLAIAWVIQSHQAQRRSAAHCNLSGAD